MIRDYFKRRSRRVRKEGIRNWLPALSPLTIFLLGFVLLYRMLTVVPIVILVGCDYSYFLVAGWERGVSVTQLMLVIPLMMIFVVGLNFWSSRAAWGEILAQLGICILLFILAFSQYSYVFPQSSVSGISSALEYAFGGRDFPELVEREEVYRWDYNYLPPVQAIVEETEANPPFPDPKVQPYYLIIRDDYTYEILEAPSLSLSRQSFFAGNSPEYREIVALQKCVDAKRLYRAEVDRIKKDDSIIVIREYGYSEWPRLSYVSTQALDPTAE